MIEVTSAEEAEALTWLAKHGRRVGRPTPLLTALIATRRPLRWRAVPYLVVAVVLSGGYALLFGRGMTESAPLYFVYCGGQIGMWDSIRRKERELRESVPSRRPGEPWRKVTGGWYLVSLAVAFGGGSALAVTIYVTTPARTYAVSWLGLLTLSALCTGWVLISTLRRPLAAADAVSLAVAQAIRAETIHIASPALAVVPLLLDLLENNGPPGFAPWLASYIAVVVALQAAGFATRRHRKLPPGDYGRPLPADPGTPVDWSPPGP